MHPPAVSSDPTPSIRANVRRFIVEALTITTLPSLAWDPPQSSDAWARDGRPRPQVWPRHTLCPVPVDAAAPPGVYRYPVQVCWGDCDPAGIVYFPRFFEKFHEAMELWFGDALSHPYDTLIVGRRLGLPSVHTEADFRVPCRFGDALDVELRVARLGRSSIELDYRVVDPQGQPPVRLTGRTVCALMDLDPARATFRRAVPWPDDLRTKIESFGVTTIDTEPA